MKKMDDRSKKTELIRVKAGDILNLLKNSDENEDVIRMIHIFSDYDPDDVLIQISDKTDQEKG